MLPVNRLAFADAPPLPDDSERDFRGLANLDVELSSRSQTNRAVREFLVARGWDSGMSFRGPSGHRYRSDLSRNRVSVEVELRADRDFAYDLLKFGVARHAGLLEHAVIVTFNDKVPIVGEHGMWACLGRLDQVVGDLKLRGPLGYPLTAFGIG